MHDEEGVYISESIHQAYGEYQAARQILIGLAPCPRCNPPRHPCSPGERLVGSDIVRCGKCGGDGFLINWDQQEDEA